MTAGGQTPDWLDSASATLREHGFQAGGARMAVLEVLNADDCALTAPEIEAKIRRRAKRSAGRASVYRALDSLLGVGLVKRIERGPGVPAGYERIESSGHHHHHFVCDDCGKLVPFEDAGLERLMKRLEDDSGFQVREHEVVLRGTCAGCA